MENVRVLIQEKQEKIDFVPVNHIEIIIFVTVICILKMTIQVKNHDTTITIEHPYEDITITELVRDFVTLAEGITFYRSQVVDAFKSFVEEEEFENEEIPG
jgi:hypothetical protein